MQDAINKNNMNNTHFEEIEMLRLFREICVGVRVMHTFQGQSAARTQYEPTHAMTHEEESRQDQALLGGSHQEQYTGGIAAEGRGEVIPWAHRDIKPG